MINTLFKPASFNFLDTFQLVIALVYQGKQWLNPKDRLTVSYSLGGSGTNSGFSRLVGIGVHCAGT